MDFQRVAVTGLGFISSIGNDRAEVAGSLRRLTNGCERFDFLPGRPGEVTVAGTVKGFHTDSVRWSDWRYPARYAFERERLRALSPHGLYALCATAQAVEEAGLTPAEMAAPETGLFTASAGSPFLLRYHLNEFHANGGRRVAPLGIVASVAGTLNFNLATHYGIQGAVAGFVSACASSSHALGYACDEIRLGRHSRMLVVGAEEANFDTIMPFLGMRALSTNPDPLTASRPFDRDRDGFVGTGGAAALVLESWDLARARGARIQAELLGWGQSADGYNVAISEPEGRGLARAMERALVDSKLAAGDIGYVNAHATSTPAGDRSEARALARVFTERGAHPYVSSTKALTGHALSMAGALEAAICVLALSEGFVPGAAHLENPDDACEGLKMPRATLSESPGVALSNSSGFGGSNVCLILRDANGLT